MKVASRSQTMEEGIPRRWNIWSMKIYATEEAVYGWMREKKMTIFGEPINHNQDYSLPSKFREPVYEIHRNIYPNPCRAGQGFEQAEEECSFTLVAMVGITFSNHLLNFPFHSLPKEVTSYPLIRFEEPRVPCRWRSMEFIEDSLVKICTLGKHQANLVS